MVLEIDELPLKLVEFAFVCAGISVVECKLEVLLSLSDRKDDKAVVVPVKFNAVELIAEMEAAKVEFVGSSETTGKLDIIAIELNPEEELEAAKVLVELVLLKATLELLAAEGVWTK